MGNIKCFQCGYFDSSEKWCCSRYNIPVDKDNKCVDSDELDNLDKDF